MCVRVCRHIARRHRETPRKETFNESIWMRAKQRVDQSGNLAANPPPPTIDASTQSVGSFLETSACVPVATRERRSVPVSLASFTVTHHHIILHIIIISIIRVVAIGMDGSSMWLQMIGRGQTRLDAVRRDDVDP